MHVIPLYKRCMYMRICIYAVYMRARSVYKYIYMLYIYMSGVYICGIYIYAGIEMNIYVVCMRARSVYANIYHKYT
jgi:hypothetical protein